MVQICAVLVPEGIQICAVPSQRSPITEAALDAAERARDDVLGELAALLLAPR